MLFLQNSCKIHCLRGQQTVKYIISEIGRPFLKWAGGKQWLAPSAKNITPEHWKGKYIEPFLGGGAFLFALQPKKAVVSDKNEELISTYLAIRDFPEKVIKYLKSYLYSQDFYYKIRDKTFKTNCSIAARMIYLNRTCWNGLYRVNQKGKFNTPFGRFRNPLICDIDRIYSSSKSLKKVSLICDDFKIALDKAKKGDFIFADPPYITGHQNNGFLKYNARLFSWEDQKRLSISLHEASRKGVFILISNADQASVIQLYKGFYYYKCLRKSLIGGLVLSRHQISEALISNYPLFGYKSEVIK